MKLTFFTYFGDFNRIENILAVKDDQNKLFLNREANV
jgi:hypothetical protein